MHVRAAPLYPRATLWFLLVLAIAVFGFWPSYFARLGENDLVHHFHAVVAGAWLVLLVVQAWLMRTRRMALHRAMGRTSLALAPLFVVSGLAIVHAMLASENPFSAAFGPRLAFVDLTTVAAFATAYGLALKYRRTMPLHARWMACTALMVFPPALARALPPLVPTIRSFEAAFHASYALTELIVLALIVHDARTDRVRAPYLALLALLLVQHAGFVLLPGVPAWDAICRWIGAL